MTAILIDLAALVGGYLLGSIPFAFVITRAFGLGDIREVGSGNVGATNVLRTGNRFAAALTLIGDVGKGALAVFLAGQFSHLPDTPMIAALGAFVGHIYPVWLIFKGGKGVATCAGIIFALAWKVGLLLLATWLVVAFVTRISSLAALVAAALSPIFMWYFGTPTYALGTAVLAALVFLTHRENIRRLLKGEEPRIGAKKPS